jgi:type II restriction enzyme
MPSACATAYKSGSQRARVVTEFWAENNLYCPNCSSPKLSRQTHNTKAIDFCCPVCEFKYQLKGQKTRFGNTITDGAYEAMMSAIRNDETPNFYFLQYDLATWSIRNLLLVPHFAFPPSAIIKRKPLSETARRAGWIGCNIALNQIPIEARIAVSTVPSSRGRESAPFNSPSDNSQVLCASQSAIASAAADVAKNPSSFAQLVSTPQEVREKFQKPGMRASVSDCGSPLPLSTEPFVFSNEEIYAFAPELEKLHPDNRHIRDKIRQQLQVLRDTGFLTHISHGTWRLK